MRLCKYESPRKIYGMGRLDNLFHDQNEELFGDVGVLLVDGLNDVGQAPHLHVLQNERHIAFGVIGAIAIQLRWIAGRREVPGFRNGD
jgi:hypothetical protein